MAGGGPQGGRVIAWRRLGPPFVATVLAAALGIGAVHWSFAPRARPAVPDDDVPARFLDPAAGFDVVAWIPYPHQNLPALERSAGLEPNAMRAALRLASLPAPTLPRFGRLAVPPSRSLVVATDLDGERFAVAARVYGPVAVIARWIGRASGNAWMTGGVLVDGEGRRVEVAWRDGVWTAGSPALPIEPPMAAESTRGGPPALLVAEVRRARSPLPAGRYHLRWIADGLDLRSAASAPTPEPGEPPAGQGNAGAFLLALDDRPAGRSQALALFSQDPQDIAELPHGAVCIEPTRGTTDRWRLPTEGLLEIAGRGLHGPAAEGVECVAGDPASRQAIAHLVPGLVERWRQESTDSVFGLWLDLAPAAAEIGRIRRGLERSPLYPPREVARWRDAERLVAALGRRHQRLAIEIATPAARSTSAADSAAATFALRLD